MQALIVFFAAILSGMGVGSGGFYLLYLTEILGMPQYAAQGANLFFFILATLASSLLHLGCGRIRPAFLWPLLAAGLLGAVGGSLLTLLVPAGVARRAFGAFLIAGGVYTLLRRRLAKKSAKAKGDPS